MDSRQSVHDASCQCERGSMKTEKILEIARRQQPRARLTDEEIEEIQREFPSRIDLFARAIERKIWEKSECRDYLRDKKND